jgi:hypothetical protein
MTNNYENATEEAKLALFNEYKETVQKYEQLDQEYDELTTQRDDLSDKLRTVRDQVNNLRVMIDKVLIEECDPMVARLLLDPDEGTKAGSWSKNYAKKDSGDCYSEDKEDISPKDKVKSLLKYFRNTFVARLMNS